MIRSQGRTFRPSFRSALFAALISFPFVFSPSPAFGWSKRGHSIVCQTAAAFEPMIRERLAVGAVYLAELWSRKLNWKYDGEKFYGFSGAPDYLSPATAALSAPKADPTPKP